MSVEVAVLLGETTLRAAGWLRERKKGPEIYLLDMFYDPGVLVPRRWKFDETSFKQGMPIKVVNHSKSTHYTISFFQFQTAYRIGKKREITEHDPVPVADKSNRNLSPRTAKEFAFPWRVVETSAEQARVLQTTRGVKDFVFALTFHDDYDNTDYPKKPKPLYPFRLRTEASRTLGRIR
ncbi:MAG: hypothetical protein JRN59_05100 [Nitrososphaerota archaeon]|nr:hypothetical protein [Nitrososphaerota archaeon]